jgi:hypothetical protein
VAIFLLSALVLGGTLWLALPRLEEYVLRAGEANDPPPDICTRGYSPRDDRAKLRIPKSFEQLKDLNILLKKYRSIYPFRVVLCFTSIFLLYVCDQLL